MKALLTFAMLFVSLGICAQTQNPSGSPSHIIIDSCPDCITAGGSGTVTSVSDLAPLFTTATRTSTPTFSLSNAAANTLFGNPAGSLGVPSYFAPTGDISLSAGSFTVKALNGTLLSSLATGILKNTTTTGVPSIAVAGDFPTLNQSTTGTAAALTATPTNCGAGVAAIGILANGNATGCFTPGGSGTVTTTGSPANGNLTKFSGTTSITNGDLSGDVTTSGTLAATIANNAVTQAKTTNGYIDLSTNQSVAGNKTLSGNTLLANLNKTIYADQQAGADACAKINASFALLPTTTTGAGGIVDATGFSGDQSCSAGITFAPASSSVLLKLGNARFIVGGSGAALTCPATMACSIYGVPTNTGVTGWGSTIIHNGAGNDGIDWFGSYGMIENLHVDSSNTVCASTCASLLIKGITGTSASHNVFNNVRLTGPGTSITNSAGIVLSADTSSALACCNTFEGVSVSAYADGIRMVTTNNQGPTDNSFYGFYDFANVTGINIVQGDVNYFLGGIISSNTTGITVTTGTGNNFHARLESNTTGCTSSGVGGFFIISEDAATCSVAAGANGDNFLGTGNTGILPSQRLQSSLILPTGTALEFDGDTGLSRISAGLIGFGNSSAGDVTGGISLSQEQLTETTAPSAAAGKDVFYGDSTSHWPLFSANNGIFEKILASPAPVAATTSGVFRVTGDFTDASSTALQTITGLSFVLPANTAYNYSVECHLQYSQATNVADAFGIQAASLAPTSISGHGTVQTTATTAFVGGSLTALTTTTATNIVAFTPTATGVQLADLYAMIENPSGIANTINIMVSQTTAADVIVIKKDSYCRVY